MRALSQQLCLLRRLLFSPFWLMAFVGRSACFSLSFVIAFLVPARPNSRLCLPLSCQRPVLVPPSVTQCL